MIGAEGRSGTLHGFLLLRALIIAGALAVVMDLVRLSLPRFSNARARV
jgi:hypothetical protein